MGDRTNRRHRPGVPLSAPRTGSRSSWITGLPRLATASPADARLAAASPDLGYEVPAEMVELGGDDDWRRVMSDCAALHEELHAAGLAHCRVLRPADGIPHQLLHADERTRGDAHDRTPDVTAGTSGVQVGVPCMRP